MNILYIGPYRQFDYLGQQSLSHISALEKVAKTNSEISLTCRPIFLDASLKSSMEQENIASYESNTKNEYDLIIQNLPVSYLSPTAETKNIAIPIVSPALYNTEKHDHLFSVLEKFNWVFLDDPNSIKTKNKNNHILYSCDENESHVENVKDKIYNIGYMNNSYKFGFIGIYKNNTSIIYGILLCFLTAFRNNDNVTLILNLLGTENDQKEISEKYTQLKKSLKIVNQIDNVHMIFNTIDLVNSSIALNTFDCYISLNDDTKYSYYEKLSTKLNKTYISKSTLKLDTIPQEELIISNDYGYCSDISYGDLVDTMIAKYTNYKNNSRSKSSKNNEYPSFEKMLCKIL